MAVRSPYDHTFLPTWTPMRWKVCIFCKKNPLECEGHKELYEWSDELGKTVGVCAACDEELAELGDVCTCFTADEICDTCHNRLHENRWCPVCKETSIKPDEKRDDEHDHDNEFLFHTNANNHAALHVPTTTAVAATATAATTAAVYTPNDPSSVQATEISRRLSYMRHEELGSSSEETDIKACWEAMHVLQGPEVPQGGPVPVGFRSVERAPVRPEREDPGMDWRRTHTLGTGKRHRGNWGQS